jgi:hypothetical protein
MIKETWQSIKRRFGKRPPPPIIQTEWGPVTEKYRQLAALNMRNDPALRAKVIEMIGIDEAKRRYPEVDWSA